MKPQPTPQPVPTMQAQVEKPLAKVSLTESQIQSLEAMFPGFRNPDVDTQSLMETLIVGFNDPQTLAMGLKDKTLGASRKDFAVASAYATIYSKVSTIRLEQIKQVEEARAFYLVDVILNQFTEDALNPELGTGEILSVKSKKKNIMAELDFLNEKFCFDQMALSVTPDMLLHGEYTLKTNVVINTSTAPDAPEGLPRPVPVKSALDRLNESRARGYRRDDNLQEVHEPGLVDVMDSVEQGTVIALEKDGKIDGYLEISDTGRLTIAQPADYIKFAMGRTKIRIDLHSQQLGQMQSGTRSNKKEWEKIPRFVRVGKSVIMPVLGKIRELQLLEALIPATKLNKLSNGTFLGIQLPASMELEKGLKAAKTMEGMLNKKVAVDKRTGELAIENILATAGRTKVIPQFGDKGTIEKLDVRSDEPDDLLGSANDIRQLILDSIGVPFELIFKSDDGSKGEILKRYARYLRRLKQVQKAISDGIKQMCFIHLANKGIDFVPEDVEVEFINKLIEIDNLDHLEFMDTTVGMLSNLNDFLTSLNEEGSPLAGRVNPEAQADFITEQLRTVGLDKIILPKSKADPTPPKGDDEPEEEPLGPEPEEPEEEPEVEPEEEPEDEE